MKNLITILLMGLLCTLYSQERDFYFNSETPGFIYTNSNFEVSAIVSIYDGDITESEFYVIVDDDTELTNFSLINSDKTYTLKIDKKSFGDYFEKSYRVILNDSLLVYRTPLQLLMKFKSAEPGETVINFGMINKIDDDPASIYSSFETANSSYYMQPAEIKFFERNDCAGNLLKFKPNSVFNFALPEEISDENYLIEFWGRFHSPNLQFFNIVDKEQGDTLLSLLYNNHRMITNRNLEKTEEFNENFVGLNAWNHYSVHLISEESLIEVYLNGQLLFNLYVNDIPEFSSIKWELLNSSKKGNFDIDLLKLWKYNNVLEKSFSNRNYLDYFADSSRILLNLNFDNSNVFEDFISSEQAEVQNSRTELRKSNCPIFSRAPEMNINIYEQFYSIDWSCKDSEHSSSFELEKSVDGSKFYKIYSIDADDDPDKIYYYSDEKDISKEVVYYRVKQINKDGNSVYSSPLKIGQGQKELFSADQNYPNPFNPITTISVEIFEPVEIDIVVYDIVGNEIKKLHSGTLSQGVHTFEFDGTELPSGIYFYEIKSPISSIVRKMILAK